MAALGFEWVPTMTIGSGCIVHLWQDELPMGRLVVMVSRHTTAVIDGVIRDTYDPSREEHWSAPYTGQELRPGQSIHPDGKIISWISRRCVYGFYIFKHPSQATAASLEKAGWTIELP
jgi:hypothetical protein